MRYRSLKNNNYYFKKHFLEIGLEVKFSPEVRSVPPPLSGNYRNATQRNVAELHAMHKNIFTDDIKQRGKFKLFKLLFSQKYTNLT